MMETVTLLSDTPTDELASPVGGVSPCEKQISTLLSKALPVNTDSEDYSTISQEIELSSEFLWKNEWVVLTLSSSGFKWRTQQGVLLGCLSFQDIITVCHREPKSTHFCLGFCCTEKNFHQLCVYSFERNSKKSALWRPIQQVFTSLDESLIQQWSEIAVKFISQLIHRPKRLWVFVNPYGGAKQAPTIWKNQVKPLFELAGIKSRVITTKQANEAFEMMKSTPSEGLEFIDGVIAVGGDGLFQEIMNGLLERSTRPWSDNSSGNHSLRLGHIPAGSTDAVAWSINGSRCPLSSALRIIFGDRMSLDVMRIESEEEQPCSKYSACLAGYGFMGDVISLSERLRFFGPLRYDIAGMMTFFTHNSHKIRISYIKATSSSSSSTLQNCQTLWEWCKDDAEYQTQDKSETGIETIEGDFISVMITVNPCRSDKSPNGLTPSANLSDGRLHLTLVRKCSRWKYLAFLLSISQHGIIPGQYDFVYSVDVEWIKVEPLEQQSSWNVDGEIIKHQTLTSTVHNGLLQVFARGIEI